MKEKTFNNFIKELEISHSDDYFSYFNFNKNIKIDRTGEE